MVGVDIGGTNSVVGIVDEAGSMLLQSRFPTQAQESADKFVPRLALVVAGLRHQLSPGARVTGMVIASPAANARNGFVDNPANFNWGRVDLIGLMRQTFDIPVSIMNDSDAAVLGESHFGIARGMNNVLLLTLGTGLGAGIMIDGKLVQGANGAAGEFGHMTMSSGGRSCACGRSGCVETYVSAPGVRRTVFELLAERVEPSALRSVAFNDLTTDRIYQLALEGDPIAQGAFEVTGRHLGELVADIVAAFDPEAVVLSGGLVNAGDLLVAPARRAFEEHVLGRYKERVKILVSTLNDGQAAILGASWFAREILLDAELP